MTAGKDVQIYLLRHGQIARSEPHLFIGQLDLPLDEEGVQQAKAMQRYLEHIKFSRIFTSPLRRAMQTVEIVAGSRTMEATPVAELAEISLGAWEGLTVDEVRQRFPGEFEKRGKDLAHYRPEGGESFADLAARCLPVFTRLATENSGPLLVVAHAGVNRALLASLHEVPLKNMLRIPQHYCCLNIIRTNSNFWHVDSANKCV